MSTTANDVFLLTMALSGDLDENNQPEDVDDLKVYALGILTTLQAELLRTAVTPITSLSDELEVSDYIAQNILPWGLAKELYKSDEIKYGHFLSQYNEKKRKIPATEEQITDVYGGI